MPQWKNRIVGEAEIDPAELVPNPLNWRTHPDAQRSGIAAVLGDVGWVGRILINKTTGHMLDGHARKLEAIKNGEKTVPVTYVELTLEEERIVLATFDPIGAMAEADGAILNGLMDDIGEQDEALQSMLDSLLKDAQLGDVDLKDGLTDPDDTPPLEDDAVTRPGDIWILGRHRLMCGDSTGAKFVASLMNGKFADAVLTDPPYGQNQAGVPGDSEEKHKELMKGVISLLPITDGVVVAFQSPRTFHNWTDEARHAGLFFERMLWMYKAAQCTFPWRGWILTSESITVCSIGNAKWQDVHPYSHDCYYLSEVAGELDETIGWHGSVKPMSVIEDLLLRISAKTNVIYEPFSGSGTTIIAAEQTGRICYAMELSPHYVDIAVRRWQEFTGGTAMLESTGEDFVTVVTSREVQE